MMRKTLIAFLILSSSFVLDAFAGSATWKSDAASSSWSDPANWTPATVPNSPTDIATFMVSSETNPVPSSISLGAMIFASGASHYLMYPGTVDYYGEGVVNNSGITQDMYVEASEITFHNSASAGDSTHYFMTTQSYANFYDNSTAGSASIDVLFDSEAYFTGQSTAGNATFTCSNGAGVVFQPGSSAGAAMFTLSGEDISGGGHGSVVFYGGGAGSASFAALGGKIIGGVVAFQGSSNGGTCSMTVSSRLGNPTGDLRDGHLDVSAHDFPGLSIGSLAGDGLVLLGTNNLTVGGNNLNTTFSGLIQDSGSVSKLGTGALTLTGANTYAGGTVVSGGILLANNSSGSATGSGLVQVTTGTLGGGGAIGGAVTVGIGSGTGAILGPGARGIIPGTLTINGKLTFKSDATYKVLFDSRSLSTDAVVARGVRIRRALIALADRSGNVLPSGTVFTLISNTAHTAIAGTFNNLPNGSLITIGSNTYQANYEGGDGNDLTLTVVP